MRTARRVRPQMEIKADRIANLLREFRVHPLNHDFQGDAISDFLVAAAQRDDPQLSHWTVALPTNGTEGPITPALTSSLSVQAKKRLVLLRQTPPQSLLVSGKKARVGGREDVLHGLSFEQAEAVKAEEKKANPDKSVPEDAFRAAMQAPLLVIYLLRGFERPPGAMKQSLIGRAWYCRLWGSTSRGLRTQMRPSVMSAIGSTASRRANWNWMAMT